MSIVILNYRRLIIQSARRIRHIVLNKAVYSNCWVQAHEIRLAPSTHCTVGQICGESEHRPLGVLLLYICCGLTAMSHHPDLLPGESPWTRFTNQRVTKLVHARAHFANFAAGRHAIWGDLHTRLRGHAELCYREQMDHNAPMKFVSRVAKSINETGVQQITSRGK